MLYCRAAVTRIEHRGRHDQDNHGQARVINYRIPLSRNRRQCIEQTERTAGCCWSVCEARCGCGIDTGYRCAEYGHKVGAFVVTEGRGGGVIPFAPCIVSYMPVKSARVHKPFAVACKRCAHRTNALTNSITASPCECCEREHNINT